MKIKEIRALNKDSLDEKIAELKKDLIKLNSQVSTGTAPKSPGKIRE